METPSIHSSKHMPASAHGPIVPVFENIWFVKGDLKMPMWMPMKISRSMTVIKDADTGELTLVNSMRLTTIGLQELEKLGKVKNVIRLAGFHGRDDGFYRDRYGATVFAIKGQVYCRNFNSGSKTRKYMQPDVWLDEQSELPIKAARLKMFSSSRPPEAVLLIAREGGILITGDALQNTPGPDEFVNFPAKLMMRKMGFYKAYNVGPGWLRFARPSTSDVRSVLDMEFQHVLPAHGDPVIGQAKEKFRPSFDDLCS